MSDGLSETLDDLDRMCFTCQLPDCFPNSIQCPRAAIMREQRKAAKLNKTVKVPKPPKPTKPLVSPVNQSGRAAHPVRVMLSAKGLTLSAAATRIGVGRSTLSDVIRGEYQNAKVAYGLANLLNVPLEELSKMFGRAPLV